MKKIFLLLFSVALLSSCDTDLDTTPSNQISEDLPFKNIEAAQTVLTGTYNWFHDAWLSNYTDQYMLFMPDVMADDVFVAQTGNYNRFVAPYQYTMTPSNTNAVDPWSGFYSLIDNANLIIGNIEALPESAERNRIQGEAHALRAYAYHFLVRMYAKAYSFDPNSPGIILRTVSSSDPHPRSTVKEVYDLMEADLLKAISLLSENSSKAYIDKRAAEAILARVYLDMGESKRDNAIQYAKAAAEGVTLMNKADYASQKFSDENSETIWAYEAGADDNSFYLSIPSFYYYADGGSYDANGKIVYKNAILGYSSLRVSQNLVDMFDNSDVRKSLFPLITGTTDYLNVTGALVTTKFRSRGGNLGQGAINYIRASEMYLIIAEAAADKRDYATAKTALNTVRSARGVADYSGSDSNLPDEIQKERRRELFGEGHRLFDIKRRGLKLTRSTAAGVLYQGQWAKMDIEANSDKFEAPIPQKEIDANKALSPADQNSYYK